MPTVNRISLTSLPSAARALNYGGDDEHPNHQVHEVEPIRVVGAATTGEFLGLIKQAAEFQCTNRKVALVDWWVVTFEPYTDLSSSERVSAERVMKSIVSSNLYCHSWHNGVGGAADLNVFESRFAFTPLPTPTRSRHINGLGRARHKFDEWLRITNAIRADNNQPLIESPDERRENRHLNNGTKSLADILAPFANQNDHPITVELIPTLLIEAGFKTKDFEITLNELLLVHEWPQEFKRPKVSKNGEKKKRSHAFNLSRLIDQLFLRRLEFLRSEAEKAAKNKSTEKNRDFGQKESPKQKPNEPGM